MKTHQRAIGKKQEWITPKYITDRLGSFDLDPCAPILPPWQIAGRTFTAKTNGLAQKWIGRVWCNPPFHRYQRPLWMDKMSKHRLEIMLIPAATETEAFNEYVWKQAHSILFLDHRPHFCSVKGRRSKANCGCSICLVSYSAKDSNILRKSGLGIVIKLT